MREGNCSPAIFLERKGKMLAENKKISLFKESGSIVKEINSGELVVFPERENTDNRHIIRRKLSSQGKMGFLFSLPAFVYMIVFVGYPTVSNFILSLKNVNVYNFSRPEAQEFIGISNYIELFYNILVNNCFCGHNLLCIGYATNIFNTV